MQPGQQVPPRDEPDHQYHEHRDGHAQRRPLQRGGRLQPGGVGTADGARRPVEEVGHLERGAGGERGSHGQPERAAHRTGESGEVLAGRVLPERDRRQYQQQQQLRREQHGDRHAVPRQPPAGGPGRPRPHRVDPDHRGQRERGGPQGRRGALGPRRRVLPDDHRRQRERDQREQHGQHGEREQQPAGDPAVVRREHPEQHRVERAEAERDVQRAQPADERLPAPEAGIGQPVTVHIGLALVLLVPGPGAPAEVPQHGQRGDRHQGQHREPAAGRREEAVREEREVRAGTAARVARCGALPGDQVDGDADRGEHEGDGDQGREQPAQRAVQGPSGARRAQPERHVGEHERQQQQPQGARGGAGGQVTPPVALQRGAAGAGGVAVRRQLPEEPGVRIAGHLSEQRPVEQALDR